jgi:hypothetical protein
MRKGEDKSVFSHRIFYVIIVLFFLIGTTVTVYALITGTAPPINPGHDSTQVFIQYGGNYVSL